MNWCITTPLSSRSRLVDDPFFSLQANLDQALKDIWRGVPTAASTLLKLDVREDDKSFQITADLPGLCEKDVEVTFQNDVLTIRGEKKVERDEKKDTWHMTERSYGSFARQLSFPANIDAEKIEAKFDKGVLSVTLPKQSEQQAKAKKITITAG